MCGIIGCFSNEGIKNWNNRRDAIRDLLIVDTVRGWDSTGVFGVPTSHNSAVKVLKKAIMAPDFINLSSCKSFLSEIDKYSFVVGHNRAATRGNVNNNSAHPFIHENVVGVHNGTMRTGSGIENYSKFDVDSDALYSTISSSTDHDKLFKELNGAFALVWFDYRDDSLHIIRNSERTLYFATVDEDTVFFASEKGMLNFALERNGFEIQDIQPFEVGYEYIMSNSNPTEMTKIKREIKSKPKNNYGYGYSGNTRYTNDWYRRQNRNHVSNNVCNISPKRKGKIKDKLNALGFDVGEQVEIIPIEWMPYGNGSTGQMFGLIEGTSNDFFDCVIHRISHEDYEKFYADHACTGQVINIQTVNNNEDLLVINPQTFAVLVDEPPFDDDDEPAALMLPPGSKNQLDKFYGPNGKEISQSEFDDLTRFGCAYCQGNLFHDDSKYIRWEGRSPVCRFCQYENDKALDRIKKEQIH